MREKSSRFFEIFKASMLILSAIIGAGLASGQEIVTFFVQYGFMSIFFLILLFFLLFYGFNAFLNFSKKKFNYDLNKKNKFIKFFDILMFFFFLVIGAAMLACLNELMNELFYKFSFPLWSFIAILISSVIVTFGIKFLLKLSAFLAPLIIVGILYICFKVDAISPNSALAFSSDLPSLFLLFLSTISYGCCNLVVSNKLLFNLGKRLSSKQIKWVSFIVSIVLVLIILVIALSMLINDEIILFTDLPLVYMAFLIGNGIGYFFSIIILLSIMTTLFAAQFSFHENLGLKKRISFPISIILFYLLSLFGFSEIVKYLYPVIGGLGFIMLFYLRDLSFKPRLKATDSKAQNTNN